MKNLRFHTLLAALTCALFAACASAATIQSALKSPGTRMQAPPFRLPNAAGKTEQLADYRGKVVVLNFWATDCGGCRLEIPWLVDIAQSFQTNSVSVLGISLDISYEDLKNPSEAWARVTPFVAAHKITYPILLAQRQPPAGYALQALPVSYLLDTHGRIAATYVGLIDEANVKANVQTLLAETSAGVTKK